MSNQVMHPSLSQLLPFEKIPNEIEAVRDALASIFDDIFVKNLIVSQSYDLSSGHYSFVLTTYNSVGINIPIAQDLKLVLNPTVQGTTEIPIYFDYSWIILKYINDFKMDSFDNSVKSVLYILFDLAEIEQKDLFRNVINAFYPGVNALQRFVNDFNSKYSQAIAVSNNNNLDFDEKLEDILGIIDNLDYDFIKVIYETVIDAAANGLERVKKLFEGYFENIEENIKEAIKLNFNASIQDLSVGLQFPRKWLQPVYTGSEPGVSGLNLDDPLPENYFSYLKFNVGTLNYSSTSGFKFDKIGSFDLNRSIIGKTGLIAEFHDLKIDLSKDSNIPEADADGRDVTFKGVYAGYVAIKLPEKWFKKENNATLQIYGRNLLIGSQGGISGKIGLETIVNGNPPGASDYMWFKLGGDNGFKIGFSYFDLTFKQNKIISSNIKAALEIKQFKKENGDPATIGLEGHLHDNGDFNLTASILDGEALKLKLGNVFTYHLRTIELGREHKGGEPEFYLGTSGKLEFGDVPVLKNLESIDINRLRIYTDGSIEFDGGTIALAKPFVLPLGPVGITVTAIHYGSIQKEVNGVMRKFNYFGFDGGVSINPLGIEVRGDGVKLFYCVDNLPDKPEPYLRIQTLYVDLTLPAKSPVVVINGWLSIPEPGTSPEYQGGIKLKIPKAKIAGGADMRLVPKDPAFIIDAEIELPVPIPLGTFAIYGFRGLIGYRYVAEKEAIGLKSGVNTWYEYYKAPPMGIHVKKFRRPTDTSKHQNPISIGAGATLGTSYDDGYTLSIKAMILLSIPSLFMIDGKANVLSERLGLDNADDPPFFAFIALGDNSLEFGFGADYKLPKGGGGIFSLYANVEAGFFFKDGSKWYVNFGTKEKPITSRVLSLITLQSYLMLSAKGIEAGARGEFVFNKTYGPVKVAAWAYVEVGGKISFKRPQFGAYLAAGVGAEVNIRILHVYIGIDLLFGAEATKPFLIYGKFRLCVSVKILFIRIKFCGNVEIAWDFDRSIDVTPINPLIGESAPNKVHDVVKGVNMLTNDTFDLAFIGQSIPNQLTDQIKNTIIPMDTYIDIKSEKGLLPGAIGHIIGGVNNPPSNYLEAMPPDSSLRGKSFRQTNHLYYIDDIQIKAWNGSQWVDYHPYKALYPNDNSGVFNNLKIGQWQKVDGQYNTIRILGTTPFSYTEQGEPGWFIPEQYGITSGSLFCEGQEIEKHCANFLRKPLHQRYYCYDNNNHFFFDNDVAFTLLNSADDEFAEVVDQTNVFEYDQSLAFENSNILQIRMPKPCYELELKLTNSYQGVRVKYYSSIIVPNMYEVQFGHPNKNLTAVEREQAYTEVYSVNDLRQPIRFSLKNRTGWDAISRVEIEPYFSEELQSLIDSLRDQIAALEAANWEAILNGEEPQSTAALEAQLAELLSGAVVNTGNFKYNLKENIYSNVSATNSTWVSSWDFSLGHKLSTNTFGFSYTGGAIIIESEHKIIEVKLTTRTPQGQIPAQSFIYATDDHKVVTLMVDERSLAEIIKLNNVLDFTIKYAEKGNCCPAQVKEDVFFTNYVNESQYYTDVVQGEEYIYAVGSITQPEQIVFDPTMKMVERAMPIMRNFGLITKLNAKGDAIWQKSYNNCEVYQEIVSCGNNEFIIRPNNVSWEPHVLLNKINDQGEILWKKQYSLENYGYNITSISLFSLQNSEVLIAVNSDILGSGASGYAGGNVFYQTHLIKINSNGDIVHSKTISSNYIVTAHNDKIALVSDSTTIVLNSNLDKIQQFDIQLNNKPESIIRVQKVALYNNQLYVAGQIAPKPVIIYDDPYGGDVSLMSKMSNEKIQTVDVVEETVLLEADKNFNFVTKIDISNNYPKTGTHEIKILNPFDNLNGVFNVKANAQGIYIECYDRKVFRFDSDLNLMWIKENNIGNYGLDSSSSNIAYINDANLFVLASFHNDRSNFVSSYIGKLDLDMHSCKEEVLYDYYITEDKIVFARGVAVELENLAVQIEDDFTVGHNQEINCVKNTLCTSTPIIYKDICGFRSLILKDFEFAYNLREEDFDYTRRYHYDYTNSLIDTLNNYFLNSNQTINSFTDTLIFVMNNFSSDIYNLGGSQWFITEIAPIVKDILEYINELGQCDCTCDENDMKTYLHSVCWLTRDEYEYNINIPSQGAISQDALATVAGINKYIQPIWRPDTSYIVHFKLRDLVNYGSNTTYPFTYGFSTVGPVGFYHKNKRSNYVKANDAEDKYPLTSLRQYIDYQRSYPNADGNLLSAKPLFYDDDYNTKISLFMSKAYAYHFFQNWIQYNPVAGQTSGFEEIKGRMKIVIKDPREDAEIINPPSLDTVVDQINIPQTIEEWTDDNDPLVPFALNQWINMFLYQGNCIFTDKPEIIKPASKYLNVKLKKLKPQKLYTAVVNNIYDLNKDGQLGATTVEIDGVKLNETQEVHKFVFQTSRYKNFRDQIESFYLKDSEGQEQVQRNAVFEINTYLTDNQSQLILKTAKKESIDGILDADQTKALLTNYSHLFDRIIEGILKLTPVNNAISTEINLITNDLTGKVIAILVRNPEPFNNPKMPIEEVLDTIQVLRFDQADTNLIPVHSKDYSQVLLIAQNKEVYLPFDMQFKYKVWNGSRYAVNTSNTNDNVRLNNISKQ